MISEREQPPYNYLDCGGNRGTPLERLDMEGRHRDPARSTGLARPLRHWTAHQAGLC
ncbi:hypothetical protein FBZ94_11129 [Bradyrhizobium sacchari]|uniref:Uncharacterized protein n=1 Tax=Bradyrhizobium sacchari TaxID=1399419 RepID=A0A560JD16_9BRAD|nr:hypothetical protein FBZ94_11129 [Bradyrhizobium sacchari]TWB69093.1 hypothetical protein FBZ95_110215 [Bradyrhizobium sacchari]